MPSRFEKYRVKDGLTKLGEAFFNPVFQDLDLRLLGLEALHISWEEAVRTVTEYGLVRINEVVGPPLQEAIAKADEIEAKRQAAIAALAGLQATIANLETNTAADLAVWKATITPTLPSLASVAQLDDEATTRQAADSALSGRVTTLENTPGVAAIAYANRATLRSGTPIDGQKAVVDGLGLFVFAVASTEPDDDESCFVTSNGAWLLEAPHWDVVDAWQLPDDDYRDSALAERAERWPGRMLSGSAVSTITSVSINNQVSFTATIPGAALGDMVVINPPNALSPNAAIFATVTAPNTVTIYINNPSAAAVNLIPGTWQVAVLKSS